MPVLETGIHLPPSPQRIPTAEVLRNKAYIQKNDKPMWKKDTISDSQMRQEPEEARRGARRLKRLQVLELLGIEYKMFIMFKEIKEGLKI